MPAIELRGVAKRFGRVRALRDVDLTVERGEVFGFLGPNGAGKSTAIDLMLDYVRPSAGSVRVLGHDPQSDPVSIHRRTGVLPDGFSVNDSMTGRRHVEFAIESNDAAGDPDAVLERVGIADAADRNAGGYSKGMQQRLVLGMALVGDPDLLVLDEPTTGLDPEGAKTMREIVRDEVDRGTTVFFSSHILEQVEAVCDRVGILNDGRIVAQDSIEGLRDAAGAEATLSLSLASSAAAVAGVVRDVSGVASVAASGNELTVACENRAKAPVVEALLDAGATVTDFTTDRTSLEELFLSFAGDDR